MMSSSRVFRAAATGLAAVLLLCVAGCGTAEERKQKKAAANLRFFLEVNRDGTAQNQPIRVFRDQPVTINIHRESFLDTGFMERADLVSVPGGHAIQVAFNKAGAMRLESVTTASRGQRVAIFAEWTQGRWLAAPVITRRIADGVFIFTPDASYEEAEMIVLGLNNLIKKLGKPYVF